MRDGCEKRCYLCKKPMLLRGGRGCDLLDALGVRLAPVARGKVGKCPVPLLRHCSYGPSLSCRAAGSFPRPAVAATGPAKTDCQI